MSAISKNLGLSSSLEEEVAMIKKEGLVSILGYSDCERTKSSSLRRTLSADMSSQKWLSQHSLKRIASFQRFPVSSSSSVDEDENPGHLEIWNSVNNRKEKENSNGHFDIWSSIASNKLECENDNNVPPPPPYIHPLVKRSASSLSEKSLQICTESLGSETGSDGFSSYPASEAGDEQQQVEEEEDEKEHVKFEVVAFPVEKNREKPSQRSSFPPPLSRGLHMQPRRDDGRLVLEAVSVPSRNNFLAERRDGRLVLTFIDNNEEAETKGEEENDDEGLFRDEMEGFDSEDDEDVNESEPKMSGGVMNVHRLALMMKKSVVLKNMNPTWSKKINEEEEEIEELLKPITLTRSPPPRPLVGRMITMTPTAKAVALAAAGGGMNAYEYYWKDKPMVPTLTSPLAHDSIIAKGKQELVVLRGNKGVDYWVPLSSKGCKQPIRRSLLFWEPYSIATS